MRKILLFISLLIAVLFLVSCAPGEKAIAGQAVGDGTKCGDKVIQAPNGNGQMEECDDGNLVNNDACSSCLLTGCGDGVVQSPNLLGNKEECDDGNKINYDDVCSNNCLISRPDLNIPTGRLFVIPNASNGMKELKVNFTIRNIGTASQSKGYKYAYKVTFLDIISKQINLNSEVEIVNLDLEPFKVYNVLDVMDIWSRDRFLTYHLYNVSSGKSYCPGKYLLNITIDSRPVYDGAENYIVELNETNNILQKSFTC